MRAACLALLLPLLGCEAADKGSKPPPTPAPQPSVTFHVSSGDITVGLEVADEPDERSRGLMYRESLGDFEGMVFVFAEESVQSFWMKNTYISLDMIFVASNKSVVGVVPDAEPLTTTARTVNVPSQYVVEVNAGFAQQHGIEAGTRLTFEHVPDTVDR